LITLFTLVLLPFLSSPAHAALGDFLYKWGNESYSVLSPNGVAVDASGNMYVLDAGTEEVKVFDNKGIFIRKWGSGGTGDGQFYTPMGIAVDSLGNVYVTSGSGSYPANIRVQKFSNTGTFILKWGSQGTGIGQFQRPWGIAIDSTDQVYVVDYGSKRVQVFDTDGNFLRQ
jgi:tripartite motif-containing protein 71